MPQVVLGGLDALRGRNARANLRSAAGLKAGG
jgi:hypothetical protein